MMRARYGYEIAGDVAGYFYRLTYGGRVFYIHGIDGLDRETAERLARDHMASREALHPLTGPPRLEIETRAKLAKP